MSKPKSSEATPNRTPPFDYLLIDGGDWVRVQAGDNPRECFRRFHKRKPKATARLFIIPKGAHYSEDGLSYSLPAGSWRPVEVFPTEAKP